MNAFDSADLGKTRTADDEARLAGFSGWSISFWHVGNLSDLLSCRDMDMNGLDELVDTNIAIPARPSKFMFLPLDIKSYLD